MNVNNGFKFDVEGIRRAKFPGVAFQFEASKKSWKLSRSMRRTRIIILAIVASIAAVAFYLIKRAH